jgi:hypothetical protein
MPSQRDLDQGGTNRRWGNTYLGPSIGWVPVPDNNSVLTITMVGTTVVYPGTSLVAVNAAGAVTLQLYQAKGSIASAQANPGTFVGNYLTIVDVSGNAGTNNITILPAVGETINGLSSVTIEVNDGAIVLSPKVVSGGWSIITGYENVNVPEIFPNPVYFKSGYPWYDIRAFGATGTGDNTTAIQATLTAAGLTGGIVYIPIGNYTISGTLIIPAGVYLIGESQVNSIINGTNFNGTLVTFSGTRSGARDLSFVGYNQSNAAHPTVNITGQGVHIDNCVVQCGQYAISFTGSDAILTRTDATEGYAANLYSNGGGLYVWRCSFDTTGPGTATNLGGGVPARANTTHYNQYDVVTFTIGGYVGLLQASVAGTTAGAPPTPATLSFAGTIIDGSVTWQFAGGATASGIYIDAAASVNFIEDCDISGLFNSGVTINGNAQGIFLSHNNFGGIITHCLDIVSGAEIELTDNSLAGPFITSGSMILFESGFLGNATLKGNVLVGVGAAGQIGVFVQGGTGFDISNNQFSNIGTCVSVAANIIGFNINANLMGGLASVWGVNTDGINVAAGTSDYFEALGNNFDGLTGTAVSWGGSGLHYFYDVSGSIFLGNSTGTGSVVLATSPTLVTPALGTPSSVTLTHGTGLPISSGVAGLGAGVATALANNANATNGVPTVPVGYAEGGLNSTSLAGAQANLEQGLTLLNVITVVNGDATESDTTSFSATYDDYLITLDNLVPVNNQVGLQLQIKSGGTFQNTGYLNVAGGATTYIDLTSGATTIFNGAGTGLTGAFSLNNVNSTANNKMLIASNNRMAWYSAAGTITGATATGVWNGGQGAITGFQLLFSAGNFASGKIKVFGYRAAL